MTKAAKCFGYFLVELRNAAGCKSRADAVKKINGLSRDGEELVSERQLFRWENGEMLPKITAALALGRAYGAEKELFEKLSECIQFSTKKDRRWRSNAKSGHVKKLYQYYTTGGRDCGETS